MYQMASAKTIVCVNFVLVILFVDGSLCKDNNNLPVYKESNDKKVLLSLYSESLCPYCHEFIVNQLMPVWTNMSKYFDIDILPYGNANRHLEHKKWVIECQHGEEECRLNMIEACAVKMLQKSNPTLLLHFFYCMSSQEKVDEQIDQKCAKEVNIPYNKLKKCAHSKAGEKFILTIAKRTEKQRPTLGWVPFIGFNGVLNRDEQDLATSDLTTALCNHITGPKPHVCNQERHVSLYEV